MHSASRTIVSVNATIAASRADVSAACKMITSVFIVDLRINDAAGAVQKFPLATWDQVIVVGISGRQLVTVTERTRDGTDLVRGKTCTAVVARQRVRRQHPQTFEQSNLPDL